MRKLLLLLAFLILPFSAQAQDNTSAADLYTKGDYLGAALKYSQEIDAQKGVVSPYLYYNLANSYFKAGDPDKAIVNYYRAFRLLPRGSDIRGNLAFALESTGQRMVPEGMPQAAFNMYYYFSHGELKGFIWGFIWLFAVVLCAYSFSKKAFLKQALVLNAVFLVFFGLWYFARYSADTGRLAVAVAPRAEVRSGPGESFPVSLSIPRAFLVTVTDTKGDWAEIEVASEKANGWVLKTQIEEI
jgi:tetratricopeptide (TPR) repeat protein